MLLFIFSKNLLVAALTVTYFSSSYFSSLTSELFADTRMQIGDYAHFLRRWSGKNVDYGICLLGNIASISLVNYILQVRKSLFFLNFVQCNFNFLPLYIRVIWNWKIQNLVSWFLPNIILIYFACCLILKWLSQLRLIDC